MEHARSSLEQKKRFKIGLCCLLLALLMPAVVAQTQGVYAWSWGTHRAVALEAIELLPEDIKPFFSTNVAIIREWSVMPDVLKGSDWYEQYRHWYHVDVPHGEERYSEGVLPWAVEYYFEEMVQAFRGENWTGAAQLAGRISHYIADASMPLHATKYYNGKHVPFEREVDAHLSELYIASPGYVPRVLDDVFDATMQLLRESYGYSQEVRTELYYVSLWTPRLKEITEGQLRAAVRLTADIWYTANVRATLTIHVAAPSPLSPENGAIFDRGPLLRWSPAEGSAPPITYEVLMDEDPSFPSPQILRAGTSTELAMALELEDGEYYWRVRARDALGNENLSAIWQFTVDTIPPEAPALLSPANGAKLSEAPTFEWSGVSDPTNVKYELWLDNYLSFESPQLFKKELTDNFYKLEEKSLPEGRWYWCIRAIDGAGNESWSDTFFFNLTEERPSGPAGTEAILVIAAVTGVVAFLFLILVKRR